MANHNIERLSEDIKREISSSIIELKDSRVKNGVVSVTRCDLTNDLSYCKVYVACLGGEKKTDEAVEGMKSAAGFFKKRIASRIKMRKMPEFIFVPDNSLEYYHHIDELISKLPKPKSEDNSNDNPEDNGEN